MNASARTGINAGYVLITGATGGLGKAFAVECASRGWHLYLTDLREAALATLAASLQTTYGVDAQYRACDLTNPQSRGELLDALTQERARLRGLINVAGLDFEGYFLDLSARQVSTIVQLNIEATLQMTLGALRLRDPLQPFRVINVASLAAFQPMPVKATYAASKRFLVDFSLALQEEVRDLGVTVTVLCPAGMATTPATIRAIEAQGWSGLATTQSIGAVAAGTLDAALAGKTVYIPGAVNRLLRALSGALPAGLLARLVGTRWKQVRAQ